MKICTQFYFGLYAKEAGVILIFLGFFILIYSLLWALLVWLISYFVVTTRYYVYIDLNRRQIQDYLYFFGRRKEQIISFQSLEKLYINYAKYNQYTDGLTQEKSALKTVTYNLYLSTDRDKIFLRESESKSDILSLVRELKHDLKIPCEDYSNGIT